MKEKNVSVALFLRVDESFSTQFHFSCRYSCVFFRPVLTIPYIGVARKTHEQLLGKLSVVHVDADASRVKVNQALLS